MNRTRLDDRRYCETWNSIYEGIPFSVSYGRDKDGQIKEVFINAAKIGSQIEAMMNDMATAVSIALQTGNTPSDLYKSMRRNPNGQPASMLGIILRDMVKASKEVELEKESA